APELLYDYFLGTGGRKHQGYPVVDANGNLLGVVTRRDVLDLGQAPRVAGDGTSVPLTAGELGKRPAGAGFPWEWWRRGAAGVAARGPRGGGPWAGGGGGWWRGRSRSGSWGW